jgi:copper chaperone CopZ
MFGLLKKKVKPAGRKITFRVEGMHCVACAMSIDGELEEMPGVVEAETTYAKGKTRVLYDPAKVKVGELEKAIKRAGYEAAPADE